MARGEPPGKKFTKSRPTASTYRPSMARTYPSSSTPTFGPGGGGAAQARLQQEVDQILPAKSKKDVWKRAAEEMYAWLGEQETLDAAERGDISPVAASAIIAAGAVPLPGAKGVSKAAGAVAKGTKKVTGKGGKKTPVPESGLTQTIGDAVGESGQKAANEAVGRKTPKTATGSKEVRSPKTKPSSAPPRREDYAHASSHSRAVSNWQKKVDAWNKANPEDQVAQETPDRLTPGRGKAATDAERQVKKADADKSSEEKATVEQGNRQASKSRRDEQREAAQQDTSDLVGVDRDRLTGFVGRRRKERRKPTSVTTQGLEEGLGAGKSVKFSDTKKGASTERRVDDLLATMRKQLAARERAEGAADTIRVDESGMLTPYSDPGRFTRPTVIQEQRAAEQAARFEAATGRKIPRTDDAIRREGLRQDPGFAQPAADSAEARLQREAVAEGRAKDADDRTRMLMDDGRLMGEADSQKRAPAYTKGPDYDPSDKFDTAYDTYSGPQPGRATTPAQAEQNVRIGRADGTVVPGRVVTPAEDLGPRTLPIIGDPRIPTRKFETGDPLPRYETPYGPRGIYGTEVGGPAYPGPFGSTDAAGYATGFGYKDYSPAPSFVVDPKDYPPLPGTRRPQPEKQKPFGEVKFDEPDAQEAATSGAKESKKGKKGKKSEAQTEQPKPQSGDNSPEARRARMYEQYRELERKGILNPGDAELIMSGGKGAKEVFDKTPTQAQRKRGVKSGEAKKDKQKRKAPTGVPETADKLNRNLRGMTAGAGTLALAYRGFMMPESENDRPVVIPGEAYDSKNAFRPTSGKKDSKPKQGFLKDKYGRRITREEFERRKAFRAKRERLRGQVPSDVLRQMTEKEMKRRKRFRSNFGDSSAYNVATRNIGGGGTQTRILDTDARKRLSGAFRG